MNTAGIISAAQVLSPRSVDLARLVSLASRATPALLRAARLEHFSTAGPLLESELWFGPLVKTRAANAIIFFPEVAKVLRAQLAVQPQELRRARSLVARFRVTRPSLVQLEEDLIGLAVTGPSPELEQLLQRIVKTVADDGHAGLRTWAAGLRLRIPEIADEPLAVLMDTISRLKLPGGPATVSAEQLANARAADRSVLEHVVGGTPVGLRASGSSIELREPPEIGDEILLVGDTIPRLVHLRSERGSHVKALSWLPRSKGQSASPVASATFQIPVRLDTGHQQYLLRRRSDVIAEINARTADFIVTLQSAHGTGVGFLMSESLVCTSAGTRSRLSGTSSLRTVDCKVGATGESANGGAWETGRWLGETMVPFRPGPAFIRLAGSLSRNARPAARASLAPDRKEVVVCAGSPQAWTRFQYDGGELEPLRRLSTDELTVCAGSPIVDRLSYEVFGLFDVLSVGVVQRGTCIGWDTLSTSAASDAATARANPSTNKTGSRADTDSHLAAIRVRPSRVAIVFVHSGNSGNLAGTWGDFPRILIDDPRLSGWDIFALSYPTGLAIGLPGSTPNPPLEKFSLGLRSRLSASPLSNYASIALVAHSMGGLIVQYALLDPAVEQRVGYVFLFGTPSVGLRKAGPFAWLFRTARDATVGSGFLKALRAAWSARYASGFPFTLRVAAGDLDEFVPASSSLGPFPDDVKRVVPGNHMEIVNLHSPGHPSAILVRDTLAGDGPASGAVDSALVAVQSREFQKAIGTLLPRADTIDDSALVQLALALEGVGREAEALALLEQRLSGGIPSTYAMGVLAGRLKRRWLLERAKHDWTRARVLYADALEAADAARNAEQSMHNAINVAFLDLMILPEADAVPANVTLMARRALQYAEAAKVDHLRLATEGDAKLMLGRLEPACERYRSAMKLQPPPRDVESMMTQALLIAKRTSGEHAANIVQAAFEPRSQSAQIDA